MTSNESWVSEKVTEFHAALLNRFREEAVMQASFRNLIGLEQTKNNAAQLELMALREEKKTLSDKLFVKDCVQKIFSNVWSKAERDAKASMAVKLYVLQSDYEAKLDKVVYEYELKMVEDNCSIQTMSNELSVVNNSKEELHKRHAAAKIACVDMEGKVRRLQRELDSSAAAFNEKLARQALELAAHFDRKLDMELAAEKAIAIEQHSAELEVLNFEHDLKLCAERDKYQKIRARKRRYSQEDFGRAVDKVAEAMSNFVATSVAKHARELEEASVAAARLHDAQLADVATR